MHDAPAYLNHALEGRLRIKVPSVKGSPVKAAALESQLLGLNAGIDHITVNPITGSVLILYDSQQTGQHEILDALGYLGCCPQPAYISHAVKNKGMAIQEFGREVARAVLQSTVEFALQRLSYALI